MAVGYFKDYYIASWPWQHNRVVSDAVFMKALPFFKMQPKDGQKENGQLPSVAVLGQGQNSGDYLVFTLMKYPRPAYRNFTNQFLSPPLLPNWFPIVSIDNCQEDTERFLPFRFIWYQERLWWRGERRMKGLTSWEVYRISWPPSRGPSLPRPLLAGSLESPPPPGVTGSSMTWGTSVTWYTQNSAPLLVSFSALPWQPPSFSLPTCLAYLKVFWLLSDIKLV